MTKRIRVRLSEGERDRLKGFLDYAIPRVTILAVKANPPEQQNAIMWMQFELKVLAKVYASTVSKRPFHLTGDEINDLKRCLAFLEPKVLEATRSTRLVVLGGNGDGDGMRQSDILGFELEILKRVHTAVAG